MDRYDAARQTQRIPSPDIGPYLKIWKGKSLEELLQLEQKLSEAIYASGDNEGLTQQYGRLLKTLQQYNKRRMDIQGSTKLGKNSIGI